MQIKYRVFRLVGKTKVERGFLYYEKETVYFKLVDPCWGFSEFDSEVEAADEILHNGTPGETYTIQKTYYVPEPWQK